MRFTGLHLCIHYLLRLASYLNGVKCRPTIMQCIFLKFDFSYIDHMQSGHVDKFRGDPSLSTAWLARLLARSNSELGWITQAVTFRACMQALWHSQANLEPFSREKSRPLLSPTASHFQRKMHCGLKVVCFLKTCCGDEAGIPELSKVLQKIY